VGEYLSSRSGIWSGATAKIEFGASSALQCDI